MRKIYSSLILKYDRQTHKLINLIEPYITWGYISKPMISELIYKRATFYGNDQTLVPLDNNIVEANLGSLNIVCIEDLIHELASCGKNFNQVINFLGFILLSPTDEVKKKIHIKVKKGGSQGFRGDKINELLKKMI
jgi:60S ribosomal protein uL30